MITSIRIRTIWRVEKTKPKALVKILVGNYVQILFKSSEGKIKKVIGEVTYLDEESIEVRERNTGKMFSFFKWHLIDIDHL